MKQRILSFTLLACIVLFSCNKGVIYRKAIAIPNNIWSVNSPLVFDVPVNDTMNKYDVFITLRNSSNYDFNNLYLFIDIHSPMNITERDTMECILASPDGRWLGNGLGDIWDNKFIFKKNVRFQKPGTYEFVFNQAMRQDSLPMIMDAGLSIEKSAASPPQK